MGIRDVIASNKVSTTAEIDGGQIKDINNLGTKFYGYVNKVADGANIANDNFSFHLKPQIKKAKSK